MLLWDPTHLGLLMVVGLTGPRTTQFVQEHVAVVSNTRKDTATTQSKLNLCRLTEFFILHTPIVYIEGPQVIFSNKCCISCFKDLSCFVNSANPD